ncbi:unnamed protein product [Didymodactylos carnosus]|uniref:Dynein light chain n=1 Tax=Didymodactylos carnosus TaxID=1234261 RepID=A0A813U8A0_9BILA|nr:unnamed protein product [Didymodactylos carnosus]CAF0824071.1 unnamed protein product [Didymodactylos carnosus]CAF3517691.1 unnamed protein product [Didymodactylos carnosus]CAF3610580.1 unnamed protein product [Didymodactylos carnosus]
MSSIKSTSSSHVKASEMNSRMEQDAVEVAREALSRASSEREAAEHIKRHFDQKHRPNNWSCIVGRNFGSYVSYAQDHFINFSVGPTDVLLFRNS